ncbi:MAG: YqiA/YcfP family alpha/beta fold hydrolase [Candidatus Bathyarchaeia archaeon]
MNVQQVKFYSEGYLLYGNLSLPRSKAPCIIGLHGLESNKESRKWLVFESKFYSEGYAFLRFNFRGCGEKPEVSEGKFEETNLTSRIKDFKSALNFLKQNTEIDVRRIGVIGSSFGGMVAIAAQEEAVKALVTLATPYKIDFIFKKGEDYYVLPSGKKVTKDFLKDLQKYNLLNCIKNLTSPILIIHGESDEVAPVEHAYKLFKAAKEPKRIEIIKGANHTFSNIEHLNKVVELSLSWFKVYL